MDTLEERIEKLEKKVEVLEGLIDIITFFQDVDAADLTYLYKVMGLR